jgi:hypothetical protein
MLFALVCILYGQVDLRIEYGDSVTGVIGDRQVYFAKYGNLIYGDVGGVEVKLVEKNGNITGSVGHQLVTWSIDGDHISGFQPCLGEL